MKNKLSERAPAVYAVGKILFLRETPKKELSAFSVEGALIFARKIVSKSFEKMG
ncbi:hypothetical protein GWN26_10240 [Candidatus Saccharibacteria bacterium]|nr:hypothetical protein [Candidatus Saccharibacteria bacterium]